MFQRLMFCAVLISVGIAQAVFLAIHTTVKAVIVKESSDKEMGQAL
ncbi:MAG: hypothetical protein HY801_08100 [Candidatus Lindowbacteria bacterium]|nr:hypothetical protein [Candidatus Lindowbacteria bacterium]